MNNIEYKLGDVVQLNEKTKHPALIGCFMVVTEPKSFGAMGFVQIPGGASEYLVLFEGRTYYRARFDEMDYIGKTNLLPESVATRESENVE